MAKRFLVIDDEKNIRLMLRQLLESEGYLVNVAVNGEEALEAYGKAHYDMVMLDLKMPGIDGMEVLRRLKEEDPEARIIMMTAYGNVERAVEAMKLGAVDFLSKPFTPDEIRTLIDEIFNRSQIEKEKISGYREALAYAKKCLTEKRYQEARASLEKALQFNVDAAEPHNLLGVLNEYADDLDGARKHYRAAMALDPTKAPARQNLERLTKLRYSKEGIVIDEEKDK
jgi:DNA-binding NtrC family response regulator